MKYKHVRKGDHFCCPICDGPYSLYKKMSKKRVKSKEKAIARKEIIKSQNEILKELED